MNKSILYASNSSSQPIVASGSLINFGNANRRCGNHIGMSGGNVVIKGIGYYDIDTNVSFLTTTAGTAVITLYKDGVAIPGATSTILADVGAYSLTIPAVTKESCCCESMISATISGVVGNVTNASIVVTHE